MESLKRITHADVYKNGVLAGKIVKDQVGVLSFTYVGEYSGAPVATTLPVNSASVTMPGGGLPSFFAGLLPEGHRLTVLRKAVKTSSDDELSLILAIGNDLPGDVQVVPEGTKPQEQKSLVMGDVRLQDFAALTSSVDGVGIAGVQTKASSSMVNAPVRIRHGILKIDPPEHPHLVANEAFPPVRPLLSAAQSGGRRAKQAKTLVSHQTAGSSM
ncbi:type II toxin-antitoxin system HipA family toxin [Corynebacterium sp.]|uniref:type II toxin-antitoxin system HipA family toxin n=1 Tax=Corynebacterium sp. TaxID=1720 RepID=UPI0027B9ED14|nr:HipA N-terminal domain-containing protein [Corynebacterium sp.]